VNHAKPKPATVVTIERSRNPKGENGRVCLSGNGQLPVAAEPAAAEMLRNSLATGPSPLHSDHVPQLLAAPPQTARQLPVE
jgi:hypothetical protein